MNSDQALQAFLEKHLAAAAPLEREACLASWELQTTSSEEARIRATELSTQLARIFANPESYNFLKSLSDEGFRDPILARQHQLLSNEFLGRQMDNQALEQIIALEIKIEDAFNAFRAEIDGKPVSDNELEEILLNSRDVENRRAAWYSSKAVGAEMADRVRELARMRNREAKRLGFDNYYGFALALQEIDETELVALLEDLYRQEETIWLRYKTSLDAKLAERYEIAESALRPWHHSNRFFQEAETGEVDLDRFFRDKNLEELTARFFSAIGLPVDDLLVRADLYEREGKCQHAFCMDVDREGDVRVLCNARPNERWMSTMLHEFGHAVYDKFQDPKLPYVLRQPAHTLTTEAVALYMGRLTRDARWLRTYAGASPEEAEQLAGEARRSLLESMLVFSRWCFVMSSFERAFYQDPEQDLDALWWSLVEKYQDLKLPATDRPKNAWAAKIHLATSPVYYHNYLLGEMTASQIQTAMERDLAGQGEDASISRPEAGQWMQKRLFHPGAARPWRQWIEQATGRPLDPAFYVAQLAQ